MTDQLWQLLMKQAGDIGRTEPVLGRFVTERIVTRSGFADALGFGLAHELEAEYVGVGELRRLMADAHQADATIIQSAGHDLAAVRERDPAVRKEIEPFLFFKGYLALQAYRVAHWCWTGGRQTMAVYLQSRIAQRFSVDIHPGARLGKGIMMDHANGIVIGETTVVEDDVSFLHSVTLGGTGKETGDRHPKIRSGVLIGAGAKVLGNIEVGMCARVAAGSLVLEDVPPNVTVAGVPARIVGMADGDKPAHDMQQQLSGRRCIRNWDSEPPSNPEE